MERRRLASYRTQPLSTVGCRRTNLRWTLEPPDVVATVYVATTETGCLAELHRLVDDQARGVASFPQHASHRIVLADIVAIDLSIDEALDTVGLTPDDIADDDWTACQAVGNAVHYVGIQALRARSATGDGHIVALYDPYLRPGQLRVAETRSDPGSVPERARCGCWLGCRSHRDREECGHEEGGESYSSPD